MIGIDDRLRHNEQIAFPSSPVKPGQTWTGWTPLVTANNRAKYLTVAKHTDGRLHAFMIGMDDRIWHIAQTSAGLSSSSNWNTEWSPFSDAGNRGKYLTVAQHADGRLHAFMIGMDNQVWHNEELTTGWTTWQKLGFVVGGENTAKYLTVAKDKYGHLHVLKISADDPNQVSHIAQTQTLTAPSPGSAWNAHWWPFSATGNRAKYLTVAQHVDRHLHAFMIGMDNQVWHNEQLDTGWTTWMKLPSMGDNTAKSLTVALDNQGRLHVFKTSATKGDEDQVSRIAQTLTPPGWDAQWSPFSAVGNRAKYLTVAKHDDGRLHAFMVGMDNHVWHDEQNATGWTGWNALSSSGERAKSLVVAREGDGRLHVFAIGTGRWPWVDAPPMLPEPKPNRVAGGWKVAGGGRWYPTAVTLPDGRVAVMGGHPSSLDTRHSNTMVEVFNPLANTWQDAGDEPLSVVQALLSRSGQQPEIYPRLHVLPDGNVCCVLLADEKTWLSAASGIPPTSFLTGYLAYCIKEMLGSEFEPWPPLQQCPSDATKDAKEELLSVLEEKKTEIPESLIYTGLGALGDWRASLEFLSRLQQQSGATGKRRLKLGPSDPAVRDSFFQYIVKGHEPSLAHRMVVALTHYLNVALIVTTNFDTLIESAYERASIPLACFDVPRNAALRDILKKRPPAQVRKALRALQGDLIQVSLVICHLEGNWAELDRINKEEIPHFRPPPPPRAKPELVKEEGELHRAFGQLRLRRYDSATKALIRLARGIRMPIPLITSSRRHGRWIRDSVESSRRWLIKMNPGETTVRFAIKLIRRFAYLCMHEGQAAYLALDRQRRHDQAPNAIRKHLWQAQTWCECGMELLRGFPGADDNFVYHENARYRAHLGLISARLASISDPLQRREAFGLADATLLDAEAFLLEFPLAEDTLSRAIVLLRRAELILLQIRGGVESSQPLFRSAHRILREIHCASDLQSAERELEKLQNATAANEAGKNLRLAEDVWNCIKQADDFLIAHRKNAWWLHLSFVLKVLACESFCVSHWYWKTFNPTKAWGGVVSNNVAAFLRTQLEALPSSYAMEDIFFLARVVEALLNIHLLGRLPKHSRKSAHAALQRRNWPQS